MLPSSKSNARCFTPIRSPLPDWLLSRKDFLKLCYNQQVKEFLTVPKSCLKIQRTKTDSDKVTAWLKKYIPNFVDEFYQKLALHFKTYFHKALEPIQLNEKIIFLYDGTVTRIHRDHNILLETYNIGQLILPDTATDYNYVKTDSIFLVISQKDLSDVMQTQKKSYDNLPERLKLEKSLNSLQTSQIIRMVNYGKMAIYFKGQAIDAYFGYIVKGSIAMCWVDQQLIENKWPTGIRQWEVKQVQKKVKNHREINSIFIRKPDYDYVANEVCVMLQLDETLLLSSKQFIQLVISKDQLELMQIAIDSQFQKQVKRRWSQINREVTEKRQQVLKSLQMMLECCQ